MEAILFILQKCLFYYHIPLLKNRSARSAYNASRAMLSQMCARFCTGHGWEGKLRSLPYHGQESLLVVVAANLSSNVKGLRSWAPGVFFPLSRIQSNLSSLRLPLPTRENCHASRTVQLLF